MTPAPGRPSLDAQITALAKRLLVGPIKLEDTTPVEDRVLARMEQLDLVDLGATTARLTDKGKALAGGGRDRSGGSRADEAWIARRRCRPRGDHMGGPAAIERRPHLAALVHSVHREAEGAAGSLGEGSDRRRSRCYEMQQRPELREGEQAADRGHLTQPSRLRPIRREEVAP